MTSKIIFCMDNPIKTDITDWLNEHIGRVSVGRDRDDYYEILAYSDQKSDFPKLHKIAKEEKAIYINSVVSEGVTAIDEC